MLFDAKVRGDWAAYFNALAYVPLYYLSDRASLDEAPGLSPRSYVRDPRTGDMRWELFTDGMLPAPQPDVVFARARLRWIARVWHPKSPPWIAIDPGSPCEVVLPYGPPGSTDWSLAAERAGDGRISMRLRTLRVGGALHGPVAHGLACGALLCVNNGSLWNAMAWHGTGYDEERRRLREWWGISTREQWQSTLQSLLTCDQRSDVWEFVLGVRGAIARNFGGHVDVGYWRQVTARMIRERSGGSVAISTDGVTKTEPPPRAEVEARVEGMQHLIGRITRYEARMRADGVLDENRYVTSVDAWDLGRASKMARWGLGARFGSLHEAEAAVVEAGRMAARSYRSWQDFSAGYILGRCLHFDEEEYGEWYTSMVDAHRILVSDPHSPWVNIPFR